MTVNQLTIQKARKAGVSATLRPLNLLNDFTELGALLLPELEMAASLSAQIASAPGPAQGPDEPPGARQEDTTHLLDALLLAVGMNQILEDYLHRDVFALAKVSKNLSRLLPDPIGDLTAGANRRAARALFALRAFLPGERRLIQCQRVLAAFTQQLADQIARRMGAAASSLPAPADGLDHDQRSVEELLGLGRRLLASLRAAPRPLRRSVIRLPACFRSFDQRPQDCLRIVQKFAERWPERTTPLLVIGARTSGSYFAPFYAAFLRTLGYQHVQAVTLRPGQMWLPGERDQLLAYLRPEGRVLLVDDPPNSGATLVQIAEALEQMGIARQSIHPVVPVFRPLAELPSSLGGFEALYLPWEEWAIHSQLTAAAVEEALGDLLSGQTLHLSSGRQEGKAITVAKVRQTERLPLTPQLHSLLAPATLPVEDVRDWRVFRGHVRGLYRMQLLDERSGKWFTHHIYVKGAGLGYFGAHSLALAERLSGFLPEVYGLREGLLFRAWAPEEGRLSSIVSADPDALAERIATYVAAHRQALALPEDVTERLKGRHPLWQRGSEDVARYAFGRLAMLIRPVLFGVARYLLLRPVTQPAVIDGSMAPRAWFVTPAQEEAQDKQLGLLKVEFDDRVFSNQNVDCCDLFYDLASASASYELQAGATAFPDLLRQHYARLTGETSSDERWLLYQVISLNLECASILGRLSALQAQPLTGSDQSALNGHGPAQDTSLLTQSTVDALEAAQRTISRIQERYFGERFLKDTTPPASGPLCAIDLDGVLETGWIWSVAITPAGALALRALAHHGYRPVIATGRSLDEVRERCQAYKLAGGMGEYGAVVYNHLTGETRTLLRPEEQADLDALRAVFQRMQGVYVSSAYRYAVRAYQVRDGERCGLTAEIIEEALRQVPGRERLRTIPGLAQTDFMVKTVDKGTGLTALAELLDGPSGKQTGEPVLAFAAGDTVSDLAMFKLAERAFAPANADAAVRDLARIDGQRVHIMQAPFQAGLLQAVAQFLGHDPRRCPTCRPLAFSHETRLFLTLLAARDVHGWSKLRQAALLAGRLAQVRWRANRQEHQKQQIAEK